LRFDREAFDVATREVVALVSYHRFPKHHSRLGIAFLQGIGGVKSEKKHKKTKPKQHGAFATILVVFRPLLRAARNEELQRRKEAIHVPRFKASGRMKRTFGCHLCPVLCIVRNNGHKQQPVIHSLPLVKYRHCRSSTTFA